MISKGLAPGLRSTVVNHERRNSSSSQGIEYQTTWEYVTVTHSAAWFGKGEDDIGSMWHMGAKYGESEMNFNNPECMVHKISCP